MRVQTRTPAVEEIRARGILDRICQDVAGRGYCGRNRVAFRTYSLGEKKARSESIVAPLADLVGSVERLRRVVVVFLVVLILIPATIEGVLAKSAELSTLSQPEKHPIEETAEQQQEAAINKEIRRLWASVLALPLQLCLLVGASRVLYPRWWQISRPPLSSRVVLAIIAWAVLTPLVLCVNSVVSILFKLMDWPSDTHPFVKLAGRPFLDSVLFIIQACIAAPIVEEALFRGAILAWTIGSRRPQAIPDVPSRIRPWVVALSGLLFAAAGGERKGPLIFVLVLIVCLPIVLRLFPEETANRRCCILFGNTFRVGSLKSMALADSTFRARPWARLAGSEDAEPSRPHDRSWAIQRGFNGLRVTQRELKRLPGRCRARGDKPRA